MRSAKKRTITRTKKTPVATGGHSRPQNPGNHELILAVVRRIPRGRVCTYGDVAGIAGLPRRARLVGTVLRQTTARDVPWHRVINAAGRISFPVGSAAFARQQRKLAAEGVALVGGRIDLQRHKWPDHQQQLDELLWKLP